MKTFELQHIIESPNLAVDLSADDLREISDIVLNGYNADKASRRDWEARNEKAIKLALQVAEVKNFPWANCSNVKFPLLTIAALQFLARISILCKGRQLVKFEAIGADPQSKKFAQAARLSTHMSLQLLEDDPNWIDDDEKAKLSASILGSSIKKTYYDPVLGTNISEFVPASNFYVDYYCRDLVHATRMTHLMYMSRNSITEKTRSGLFCEMDDTPSSPTESSLLKIAADDAAGIRQTDHQLSETFEILEQHCWYDFDGDGYAEPYVITVRADTGQVLRIVARFYDVGDVHRAYDSVIRKLETEAQNAGQTDLSRQSEIEKQIAALESDKKNHIVRIDPQPCFTKLTFIPSPDSGFYGLGLGALLGPMNESVNTLTNQLIDSGTMSNTAGGFLGRGVKLKAGTSSFSPFEWKPVDSTGDDLRKNVFPLPVREPSTVLFQLLGLLVSYGEKISGATDIMTGVSPGQNTPAETSRNTVEQGMMLFSGIYTRMYRSFREELKIMYDLNRLFLESSPKWAELTEGDSAILSAEDYKSNRFRIFPAADASVVSQTQRREKAALLMQVAQSAPGFNMYLVVRNFLEANDFPAIDSIYPDPKGPNAVPPPQNPKIELEKAKLQQAAQAQQAQLQMDMVSLRNDIALGEAKIIELQAKATKELAEAQGVETGHQIAMIEAQIGAAKLRQEGLLGALNLMQKTLDGQMKLQQGNENGKTNSQGRQAGMGGQSGDAGTA